MPKFRLPLFLVILLASGAAFAQSTNTAVMPVPMTKPGWMERHESMNAKARQGKIDLIYIGDSIVQRYEGVGKPVWDHYYALRNALNLGISSDRTQHVIWRIENGELEGLTPKVTVLMIGTNNSAADTAAEITAANKKIIGLIRAKMPATKVLLLAIFPRGARQDANGNLTEAALADAAKRTAVINDVNADLAKLDDGVNVRFLDIAKVFYGQDGKIPHAIMPDQLHPNAAGYQLWADAMKPLLADMLK